MIELRGLRVLGVHGVLEHEQQQAQPFELDLVVETDLAPAGLTDDLEATVDYGRLVGAAAEVVTVESHRLLESLASSVARALLACDSRVESVTVSLTKLRPPLAADVASVGVRITRYRDETVAVRVDPA